MPAEKYRILSVATFPFVLSGDGSRSFQLGGGGGAGVPMNSSNTSYALALCNIYTCVRYIVKGMPYSPKYIYFVPILLYTC